MSIQNLPDSADYPSPPPPYVSDSDTTEAPVHHSSDDPMLHDRSHPASWYSWTVPQNLGSVDAPSIRRYLYYRIYSSTDGVKVKHPEVPGDPYLGRALTIRIPPPHTAANVRRHICGREDVPDDTRTILVAHIGCHTPLEDIDHVDITDPIGPGSSEEDPIALVVPEVSKSVSRDEPTTSSAFDLPQSLGGVPRRAEYTYRLRTIGTHSYNVTRHPKWLSYRKGQILYTNGIIRQDTTGVPYLWAQSDVGKVGKIYQRYAEFVGPRPHVASHHILQGHD